MGMGMGPVARRTLVTAMALLCIIATALLGRWQMGRAEQKQQWQAALERQAAAPSLAAADLRALDPAEPQAWLHRRVALQGRWLAEQTVYLDNRQMQGRPGFFVLTPLQLDGGATVLVQRGWVARDFQDRSRLAPVQTPAGTVQVAGRLAGAPASLYALAGGAAPETGRIRQNWDWPAWLGSGPGILSLTVVQTGAPSEGLLRDWPVVDAGVAKHHGYAAQWFGLSALVALLWLWFQCVRPLWSFLRRPAHVPRT